MRRSQRALCRLGAGGRLAGARCLRHSRRPIAIRLQESGHGSAVITKAQHCRSEVYLAGFGWVPVDAADVRKVVLEEPPTNLAIDDPKVVAARKALFGSWETNWLAYNFAHDVALPGSRGPKLGFLMYPQAETAGMRLDCLDPDNFKYTITAQGADVGVTAP